MEKGRRSITREKSEEFNPWQDFINQILIHQEKGDLAVIVMIFVIIYNIIIFQAPQGFGIYSNLPIIMTLIAYFSHYWENVPPARRAFGIIILFLSISIDLILSITYIPDPSGGYGFESLPTLILDIIAFGSLTRWLLWRSD